MSTVFSLWAMGKGMQYGNRNFQQSSKTTVTKNAQSKCFCFTYWFSAKFYWYGNKGEVIFKDNYLFLRWRLSLMKYRLLKLMINLKETCSVRNMGAATADLRKYWSHWRWFTEGKSAVHFAREFFPFLLAQWMWWKFTLEIIPDYMQKKYKKIIILLAHLLNKDNMLTK